MLFSLSLLICITNFAAAAVLCRSQRSVVVVFDAVSVLAIVIVLVLVLVADFELIVAAVDNIIICVDTAVPPLISTIAVVILIVILIVIRGSHPGSFFGERIKSRILIVLQFDDN